MYYRERYSRRQQRKRMLYKYIGFLAILSISIVLMPIGNRIADSSKVLSYLSGALFWIGLVGTIVMEVIITKSRKRSRGFQTMHPNHRRLGLIHFFQSMPAIVCDSLMFVSLVGFVIARIFVPITLIPYIFLSLLFFFFGMHCMLNGSNYIYINYKLRRETES